ncbi:hypothetical protein [Sulfurovum sp.]|uniref:hypothetical protein n=1 Tax=Sulfurovum sp. TaxID=1969726 RepID=UPI0025F6091E|nr:hypothetical protein [Sulfurovum sp.]
MKLAYYLILLLLSTVFAFSAEVRCGQPYTIVLNGQMHHTTHGYTIQWSEHMELEKVHKSGGIDGRWKISKWIIRTTMPMPAAVNMEQDYDFTVPRSGGMHGRFHMSMHGSDMTQTLTSSHLYLDIKNNRIGWEKTNLWFGEIYDNLVSLQFFQPEQLKKRGYKFKQSAFPSTNLTGFITRRKSRGIESNIKIVFPDNDNDNNVIFSPDDPAVAAITARIKSSKPLPEGTYTWSIDTIESTEVEIIGNGGKQVVFHFKGLPEHNSQFGKHHITVKYRSADAQCTGNAESIIKLFYLAFAYNHPSRNSQEKNMPNWFYYWKQTPAAKPHGDNVRLLYGGRTACNCNNEDVVACYGTGSFNKVFYLCDLSRAKFKGKMQTTYPILDRTKQHPLLGWQTTEYIDTYAVSLIHEYQHYLDEMRWQRGKSKAQIASEDRDKDDIPDTEEPALHFDLSKRQTYKPVYRDNDGKPVPLDVQTDEEWIAYESMRSYRPGTYNKYDWGCPGAQVDDKLCKDFHSYF